MLLALPPSAAHPTPPRSALASGPPPAARASVVRAASDLDEHDLTDDLALLVAWGRALPPDLGAAGPVTLPQALARARTRLDASTTSSQRATLKADPVARSAARLQGAAAAALVDGRPDAALAALLLASELAPRDPMLHVNLAGLLARMGMPHEALALLDAAAAMPGALPSPMGIPGAALALNTRGYALLLLGRWDDAAAPLRDAMARAPLLAEAARNLATALALLGREDEAKRVLFFGVWRSRGRAEPARGKSKDAPQDGAAPPAPRSPADVPAALLTGRLRRPFHEVLDLSAGVGANLPAFRHPTSSAEVVGMDQAIRRHNAKSSVQLRELALEAGKANQAVGKRRRAPASRRSSRILSLITGLAAHRDPELRALVERTRRADDVASAERIAAKQDLVRKVSAVHEVDVARERAIIARLHDAYVDRVHLSAERLESAIREEWSATHQRLTGLAANLSDPAWHAWAVAEIRFREAGAVTTLLAKVGGIYAPGGYLLRTDLPDFEAVPGGAIPSCRKNVRRQGMEVGLGGIFSVKVRCDAFEVGVASPGWLGVFAKTQFSHGGDVTVIAGVKATSDTPLLPAAVTLEEGFFVTVNDAGLKDVGVTVSLEASHKVGPGVAYVLELESVTLGIAPSAG